MSGFVQIIEFESSRRDEIQALADDTATQPESGTVRRATITGDRDRPTHFVTIVEFDSYESAMENSDRPETTEFAAKLAALCDGPPTFHNLDVIETWGQDA